MKTISCTCPHCVSACKRVPGLFTPVEALAAVRAGLADDMMARWDDNDQRGGLRCEWQSLMPRSIPIPIPFGNPPLQRNTRRDAFYCAGRCVFLNVDNRCAIHDFGFKPIECRSALLCGDGHSESVNADVRRMWNTPVGRYVVAIWKRELAAIRDAEREA